MMVAGAKLTSGQLLSLLVGLKEVNDLDVGRQLIQCDSSDAGRLEEMISIIDHLFDHFDCSRSPKFLKTQQGKSQEVREMQLRLLTAEKRAIARKGFGVAMAQLLESPTAYELVASECHPQLDKLKTLLTQD